MSQRLAVWPGPCELAIFLHGLEWGPPATGSIYRCYTLLVPQGPSLAVVYAHHVSGTYRCQVTIESLASPSVNLAVTTHDFRWTPAADPEAADFQVIEARLDTFWGAIAAQRSPDSSVTSYRWTPLADDGSGASAPSVRSIAKNILGLGTATMPHQVSCAVTEITDVRRRWGRFYVPFVSGSVLIVGGRYSAAAVGAIANAAAPLHSQQNPNWQPSVYGAVIPTSLMVRQVRVDDIPDIIRSRRLRNFVARSTVAVPT